MTGAVLFDFDGTLVDTFDDIVEGVQRMRAALGGERLPPPQIRRHIGWGTANLVAQCHPRMDTQRPDGLPADGAQLPLDADEVERSLALFRDAYSEILMRRSRAYPGAIEMCHALSADGVALAIVSNKPERFVRLVMAALGMVDDFALVLGGDSLAARKPDPQPLRHAAATLGQPPGRCIMVGDGTLDLEAARSAGMPGCGVTWGLLGKEELVPLAPAYIAESIAGLETWLRATLKALAFAHPPAAGPPPGEPRVKSSPRDS